MIAGTLSPAEAATAGYGRGLLHWHHTGGGGDVAHTGVRVFSQDVECDVEDSE